MPPGVRIRACLPGRSSGKRVPLHAGGKDMSLFPEASAPGARP